MQCFPLLPFALPAGVTSEKTNQIIIIILLICPSWIAVDFSFTFQASENEIK